MQELIVTLIVSLVAALQARPMHPPNFVLWNYFPFLQQQQQHIQRMQQMMQPVNMPNMPNIPYPGFDLYLNHGVPMAGNMPFIGELQFDVPVQPVQHHRFMPTSAPSTAAPTTTPAPTTTTTSTTTTKQPRTTPTTTTTRPRPRSTKRRTSVRQSTPPVAEALKSEVSKGIFEMARTIQANILAKDPQTVGKFNVFSPINVAAVLSLLELGAKGQTHQELQHILNFDKTSSADHHHALGQMLESLLQPQATAEAEGAQIDMANGIFMQTGYSMNPDYRSAVEAIYQSQLTALDFQRRPAVATQFINDWVSEQTNGKIENILANGIDSSTTRMMVASAVYFKALWTSSFIPAATSKRAFYPNGKSGQKIMVDTMGNGGQFSYHSSSEHDCSIVALPFKGDATTMYVVLPNESNAEKLKQLQKSLTADVLEDMISKMKMHSGIVTLPKMHLSDTLEMSDMLGDLSVFDGARSDLSGITEHGHMTLDGFVHKVDLTINETGTEAAAATVSSLTREEFEFEFRADSPFMFVVRHDATKLPIFYGSVLEPVNV